MMVCVKIVLGEKILVFEPVLIIVLYSHVKLKKLSSPSIVRVSFSGGDGV